MLETAGDGTPSPVLYPSRLQEFSDHTVLCIAHRISTIMSSDRVCVLDAGKLAEMGPPLELMEKDSRFAKLAQLDAA